jgi:hypothetical protein
MAAAYGKPTKRAKPSTGKVVSNPRQDCLWFAPVLDVLMKKFKTGFASEMRLRTGRDESVIQRWKTGKHAPDGFALNALINSDVGDLVIRAMTRSNNQPWAKALRRTHEISQLRTLQAETQHRLEALERGLV